jgi:hypothetical protein
MTTYRSPDVETLRKMAAALLEKGYEVSPVVVPENPWVDGNPYFHTSAPCRTISDVRRDVLYGPLL